VKAISSTTAARSGKLKELAMAAILDARYQKPIF
jgi:hypothetical protein